MGAMIREKEVALRATKEENEVLSFNNERLTKRVTILQKAVNEQVSRNLGRGANDFFSEAMFCINP
jgi:hypothetical protein